MLKHIITFSVFLFSIFTVQSQDKDSLVIQQIFEEALTKGKSFDYLNYMCTKIGGRLSGSVEAEKAVEYTYNELDKFCDQVKLQPVKVPHWERGIKEVGYFTSNGERKNVAICALGGSIATPENGIEGNVVEVQNFKQLRDLGNKGVKGKIVFFNRPMNPVHMNTFTAYSGGVDQRWAGAMEAAKQGAIAIVVRSLSVGINDFPHTGSMGYDEKITKIPASSISTKAAFELSKAIKKNPETRFYFKQSCKTFPDAPSNNVIGELKGTEFPQEYIVVGGHLDSWDLGQGAHDDGAGCAQSIEALRILKAIGYTPKRTLRAVMFMNEENGMRGAKEYGKIVSKRNEKHIAAIESDRGGFIPKGFSLQGSPEQVKKAKSWAKYFEKYGMYHFKEGGSGADIAQIKTKNVFLMGLVPDSQRYFDYHHATSDNIDAVNQRELELGAAAMAAMIYLLDQYGN